MKIRTELIELYMKRKGLTKKEFCEKCKISFAIFDKIMRNDYKCQTAGVIRVAEAMEIELCDIYVKD